MIVNNRMMEFEPNQVSFRFLQENDAANAMNLCKKISHLNITEEILKSFCSPRFLSLVAVTKEKNNEKIIGMYIAYRIWHSKFSFSRNGIIFIFGVEKHYRQHGIGSALLQTGNYILHHHYNCKLVGIDIRKSNKIGYIFLDKNGFHAQYVMPNLFVLKDKKEDGVFMSKELSENTFPEKINIEPILHEFVSSVDSINIYVRLFGRP